MTHCFQIPDGCGTACSCRCPACFYDSSHPNPRDAEIARLKSEAALKEYEIERLIKRRDDLEKLVYDDFLLSDHDKALTEIAALRAEVERWTDTARSHAKNAEFYRGIVVQVGEGFGVAAKTSDDGSVQQDVLALRVPQLAAQLREQLAEQTIARANIEASLAQRVRQCELADESADRADKESEAEMDGFDLYNIAAVAKQDKTRAEAAEAELVFVGEINKALLPYQDRAVAAEAKLAKLVLLVLLDEARAAPASKDARYLALLFGGNVTDATEAEAEAKLALAVHNEVKAIREVSPPPDPDAIAASIPDEMWDDASDRNDERQPRRAIVEQVLRKARGER